MYLVNESINKMQKKNMKRILILSLVVILEGSDIFWYPFGQYNQTSIKALKQTGYRLAVTTKEGRVKKGDKKYELPRVRISANTKLEYFKKLVE